MSWLQTIRSSDVISRQNLPGIPMRAATVVPEYLLISKEKGTTMPNQAPVTEALLTPAEVATMFRVDPKTVTRWAKAGKLSSIRTLGGHRRYKESEVRALLGGVPANG
jgi:excisionase family DNA binding protein